MGCITSTKKLNDLHHNRHDIFRVRVVRVLPSSPTIYTGYLELTSRELIFVSSGCEPVVWALQHLRRYGLNGDLFSFEAGRRCMSGPGIYTFRCEQAEALYPLFQRYINAVNTDAFSDRERVNSAHNILARTAEPNSHSNNYLEPAPLPNNSATIGNVSERTMLSDPLNSLSPEMDSPDSLQSLPFNNTADASPSQVQSPNTPGTYINTNIYFDQPLRTLQEYNNNSASGTVSSLMSSGSNSAFSTIKRRTLLKGCSLDVPPQEKAPMLSATTMDSLHMYANVDTPGACSITRSMHFDTVERCYENVNRKDLPLLLQLPPHRADQQQQPKSPQALTPTTPTSNSSIGCINYIELDLDPPRSPGAQNSPKSYGTEPNIAASAMTAEKKTLSLPHVKAKLPTVDENPQTAAPTLTLTLSTLQQSIASMTNNTSTTATTSRAITTTSTMPSTKAKKSSKSTKPETPLSYSTIDFIKTCALIKSSTHGEDFVEHRRHQLHDSEELRITRHSKCVRKSYSISE